MFSDGKLKENILCKWKKCKYNYLKCTYNQYRINTKCCKMCVFCLYSAKDEKDKNNIVYQKIG